MTSASRPRADPLRHLDENKVLEALRLVRRGQVIPLNLRLDGPPVIRGGRPSLIRTVQKHNETRPRADGSLVVNDDSIEMWMQASSHWDALAHWGAIEDSDEAVFYGGAGLDESSPELGARSLGIDLLASGVVTRGVVLDMVDHLEGASARFLEDDHDIGLSDVESYLAARRLTLLPGDAVVVYTGFQHRLRERGLVRDATGEEPPRPVAPGLRLDTLPLWERAQVFALVSDNPAVEPLPMPEGRFHTVALKHLGIHLGELWALDELVGACRRDRVFEFMLVSTPLYVHGAFGSPANTIALR